MKVLYEILVPTQYGYPVAKPIRTVHHKQWDKFVKKVTGGLTILSPAKGIWVNEGIDYPEKVIPVRVMCEEDPEPITVGAGCPEPESYPEYYSKESQIDKIIDFTLLHYRQKAVMYYVISNQVIVRHTPQLLPEIK